MIERQKKYPQTMNTTSTHDTKRGEDARARLNVLTNIPEKWMIATKIWRKLNREYKFFEGEKEIPTPNDEYFIYQVLCAHLPMDGKIDDLFLNRLQVYLVKALREAKVNSSWSTPDENYESKTLKFVLNIVSEESNFLENFLAFMREIIPYGIVNSITQTILKNTCPGIPDTYQGCEDWNLSFVDPDNRRRVNFKELSKQLKEMIGASKSDAFAFADKLLTQASNGQIKHWITYKTLLERKMHENLFLKGAYIPLKPQGKYKKNLIAFLRHYHNEYCLIILPLKTATLPIEFQWGNTFLDLPENVPNEWENRLTKVILKTKGTIYIAEVFTHLPFGILGGISKERSDN
jgi:maltooligosyltrehalose synthase